MWPDTIGLMRLVLSLALVVSSEAFFLKWGSDTSRQTPVQKSWIQQIPPNMSPAYRYYSYSPYETRKMYQMAQYAAPPELPPPSMAPIPISVPAGASLTPVSLQHVQLVPCMCPVAPEEADKLQEQGPGPYLAQTYAPAPAAYAVPQQIASSDKGNAATKQ